MDTAIPVIPSMLTTTFPKWAYVGPCCACGTRAAVLGNIFMLPKRAPVPGTGWGCFVCGLPPGGAVYVVCDPCLDLKREPKDVCQGFPWEAARVSIEMLTEPFGHDMAEHEEEAHG